MTVLLIVCLFDGFIIQIAALPRTDSVISTTRTAQLATTTMNSELSFRDFMSSKNLKKVSDFLPYLVAQTHFSLQEFTHTGNGLTVAEDDDRHSRNSLSVLNVSPQATTSEPTMGPTTVNNVGSKSHVATKIIVVVVVVVVVFFLLVWCTGVYYFSRTTHGDYDCCSLLFCIGLCRSTRVHPDVHHADEANP
jgi:hypothetical protein